MWPFTRKQSPPDGGPDNKELRRTERWAGAVRYREAMRKAKQAVPGDERINELFREAEQMVAENKHQ